MGRLRRFVPIERDPATGRWTGPFLMASFNTRIVRLSNTLTDWSYGRELRYREVTDFGSGPMSPVHGGGMAVGLGGVVAGLSFGPDPRRARPLPAEAGGGPAARRSGQRDASASRSATTTTTGARYRTEVGADYDPGYGGTAIMFGQAVLCLALDGRLPSRRRADAGHRDGDVLVERLRAQGFTFDVEPSRGDAASSRLPRRCCPATHESCYLGRSQPCGVTSAGRVARGRARGRPPKGCLTVTPLSGILPNMSLEERRGSASSAPRRTRCACRCCRC